MATNFASIAPRRGSKRGILLLDISTLHTCSRCLGLVLAVEWFFSVLRLRVLDCGQK